jgi:RNA polymerase sigma-70 factor, ECF subfamily
VEAGTAGLDRRAVSRVADRPTAPDAAALFEAHEARIRAYIAFRIRGPADVDDLTSEVFRRLVAGPAPLDPAAVPAWLFRVAHNAVVDHYRRRRFPDPLGAFIDRPDDAPALPDQAIRAERLRQADAALRGLPGRQRAAVYLRYYEGLDFAEVGEVLGAPAATARSLVHRGLKRVARALRSREER